jgi:hypothetical protein
MTLLKFRRSDTFWCCAIYIADIPAETPDRHNCINIAWLLINPAWTPWKKNPIRVSSFLTPYISISQQPPWKCPIYVCLEHDMDIFRRKWHPLCFLTSGAGPGNLTCHAARSARQRPKSIWSDSDGCGRVNQNIFKLLRRRRFSSAKFTSQFLTRPSKIDFALHDNVWGLFGRRGHQNLHFWKITNGDSIGG